MCNETHATSLPSNSDAGRLYILRTEEDKHGTDLTKMSDFFSNAITQLFHELDASKLPTAAIDGISVGDLAILNEVIQRAEVITHEGYQYVPDFDHLPKKIRDNLNKGTFTIGESRQVDGNYRAVILDENGVRIRDVTLKKVVNDPSMVETTRSIATQLQLKQINEKLAEIQELQQYQIEASRDHAIQTPFLDARDFILYAQNASDSNDRTNYLDSAIKKLTSAVNAVYADIKSSSAHLIKLTRWPIFRRQKLINQFVSFITQDVQTLPVYIGVLTLIFEYLGQYSNSKEALKGYLREMTNFFNQQNEEIDNMTLAELVHLNFPYTKDNRDCWLDLSERLQPAFEKITAAEENNSFILVALEDGKNEE